MASLDTSILTAGVATASIITEVTINGVPTFTLIPNTNPIPAVIAPTATASPSAVVKTVTATPAPTATASAAPASSSPPLSTLLPAILAPVVFVLALIPILICTYLHFRNKKQREAGRASPDYHGPPAETALLQHKTSRSLTLPSPFSDSERTHDGSLGLYDIRNDHGDRRSNGDIVALYERRSNRGSYDHTRGASPKPPPAAVAARAPSTNPARGLPPKPSRGPAPGRGAAKPQAAEAQWPLPATALPSPNSLHKTGDTSKPLPPTSSGSASRGIPQLPPMTASEPFSMREELRPDSDTYDLSTSAARNSGKVRRGGSGKARGKTSLAADGSAKRESDLVSELSQNEGEEFPRRSRRDTDAVSMISAMTGRSQSGRRKSTASVVSAMSPNDEPEMPKPFAR